jgi:hypothetical protein
MDKRNNFFAFMRITAIIITIIPTQTLQMYFIMIGIVGFSINAATAIGNEFSSKWGKYKLTLPVRRTDIVKSLFLNQLLWIIVGVFFVGITIALSFMLHGFSLEQFAGIASLFALGISISFFMGALFIPLIYLAGEDKVIVFLIISLLCAVGIAAMFFNITDAAPLLGAIIMMISSLLLFILSYPLTVCIFKRKEY